MNNKPHLHKGKPLTQLTAMEIISKVWTSTSGRSITTIKKYVHEAHEKDGGLPIEEDLEKIVAQALSRLSLSGKASRVSVLSDVWVLPRSYQQIFGSGKHWVYLYYFSKDKEEAESKGKSIWRCKIGRANKEPEERVKTLTSGVPVPPRLALLLRTDEHAALEKAIHGVLTVRGRHLKHVQGKEWFLTNPEEVKDIYDFIIPLHRDVSFLENI